MIQRLKEYQDTSRLLRQIQSDKALYYRKWNTFQNVSTVVISSFITVIGFSGIEKIGSYISLLLGNEHVNHDLIEFFYNLSVFSLFVLVILHLVFQFNTKQNESEKAITLLSNFINEIEDNIESIKNNSSYDYDIKHVRYKYNTITDIIPSNTDKEYFKAMKSLSIKNLDINDEYYERKSNYVSLNRYQQEQIVLEIIKNNRTAESILDLIKEQEEKLYIGGGVIRNLVWDHLHYYENCTPINDIDVIYFNQSMNTKAYDVSIENRLKEKLPNREWSVSNQARMHTFNNDSEYNSLEDAVSKWPDTASSVLVRKDNNGQFEIIAPHGLDDLFRLIVRPTPHYSDKIEEYKYRVEQKNWESNWKYLLIL